MKSEKELQLVFFSQKKIIGEVPKMLALGLMLFKCFIRYLEQKCQCDNEFIDDRELESTLNRQYHVRMT